MIKSYYKELIFPIIFILLAIIGLIFNIEIESINYTLGMSGAETKLFYICLIIANITFITEIVYQEKHK